MRIDFQNAILLVLCFALLLSVFSLSANAATSNDVFVIPVSSSSLDSLQSSGVYIGSDGSYSYYCSVSSSPAYGALFYTSSGGQQVVQCYCLSESSQSLYYVNSATHNVSTNILASIVIDGITYYYGTTGSIRSLSPSYEIFANETSAKNAILDYIANPPAPPIAPSSFQYSLPPGNVAYIEMGSSSAIKLSMDFPELSNSFGTPFSKANSAYALVDSLPIVGSSVASGTVIPWAKSGRLNLIGQTSEASFGPVGPIATRYVAVINPSYYDHVLATGTYRQNPPIQIDALNVLSIQVYPLQSDFTFNNDTGQVSTTIAGDAYTGDVDSETGDIYWTDPDGGSSAPALGGNNLPEAGNSIFDTLRNIASDFSEFLKGPVSAIRVVVSSIREFMGSFTQLYTWLPSPVYNLITSALMIALTIGVIKIFV